MEDLSPFDDFDAAAMATIRFLREKTGFDLWMATRRQDEEWLVLQIDDEGYDIKPGEVFQWNESMCMRMVGGEGPTVAHDVSKVPAYRDAPIADKVTIGAYIGVPLTNTDGSLFGTLCAINREPVNPDIANHTDTFMFLGRLLSTVLNNDIRRVGQERLAERFQRDATTDSLTGLKNRRGWEEVLAAENSRTSRYGHSACVIAIDLDGLKNTNDFYGHSSGDQLLKTAALALSQALREQDVAARVGGDEFAVLGIECDAHGAQELLVRIQKVLSKSGVRASVGMAVIDRSQGLEETWMEADRQMYAEKRDKTNNKKSEQ